MRIQVRQGIAPRRSAQRAEDRHRIQELQLRQVALCSCLPACSSCARVLLEGERGVREEDAKSDEHRRQVRGGFVHFLATRRLPVKRRAKIVCEFVRKGSDECHRVPGETNVISNDKHLVVTVWYGEGAGRRARLP